MSKGYVYILSNPAMPGIVKIGRTTGTVEDRARQLFQTGVPTQFKIEDSIYSPDCSYLEQRMHEYFSADRIDQSREFFTCEAVEAYRILVDLHREQVEEWLDEFIPDQVLVDADLMVDPSTIAELAHECGVHPVELASAMRMLQPEDLAAAIGRYREWVEHRKAERLARQGATSDA